MNIVKANASLTSGGIAVLSRSINNGDAGQMFYVVRYCCLEQYKNTWVSRFRIGSEPPTTILPDLLAYDLTKQPTLANVNIESVSGLTYIDATYSAGVRTDVVETTSSEQRNLSWTLLDGEPASFDYISYTVTRSTVNNELEAPEGSVGAVFNAFNCNVESITNETDKLVFKSVINSATRTKRQSGEYVFSVTSTGVYLAKQVIITPDQNTPNTIKEEPPAAENTRQEWTYRDIYPGGVPWMNTGYYSA